jgi:hypothetical protein
MVFGVDTRATVGNEGKIWRCNVKTVVCSSRWRACGFGACEQDSSSLAGGAWSFTRQIARAYGTAGGLAVSSLVPAQVSSSVAFLKRVACPANLLSATKHHRFLFLSYARPNAREIWRSTK